MIVVESFGDYSFQIRFLLAIENMINTAKLRKRMDRRRLQKLAIIADKLDDDHLIDKQDEMLSGLDDGWEGIRKAIVEFAGKDGEWAGYPLMIEHSELVIEPRHPLYKTLNGASFKDKTADDFGTHEKDDEEVVNQWRDKRGWTIFIVRNKAGKSSSVVFPCNIAIARAEMILATIGASQAWSVEAEFTALARLKTLITAAAFRYYLLTGTFLETSPRSKVTYMFRKLRPTIALAARGSYTSILAALCLHPIGYYKGTFAGSMTPTDDLICHLTMMRGDERKFWSKCNQHEAYMPEAGI